MPKNTYQRCSLIHSEIEPLFNFHLDTRNVKHITPPDTEVDILEIDDVPLKTGSKVKIKATKWMLPQTWKIRIDTVHPGSLIVDVAESSPFRSWRHEHRFEHTEEGVRLCDYIEYELPFGPFGMMLRSLVERDLDSMFAYRHAQTKAYFETTPQGETA